MSLTHSDLSTPTVSVIMPVYNEAVTIADVVRVVLQQPCVQELLIVDDCSSDGSWEVLNKLTTDSRVRIFRHETNQGKGAALRTGISKAIGLLVLIQDADFEYDPAEYGRLIQPILVNKADVVFGSRFSSMGAHRVLHYWHYVGNQFLTMLSNMATNLNISDMETCYKVFRREIIQKITIEENRFGFEPEITAKIAKLDVRIYEVPISYYGRTYEAGKKIGWRDGVRAIWCIIKYNFRSTTPEVRYEE